MNLLLVSILVISGIHSTRVHAAKVQDTKRLTYIEAVRILATAPLQDDEGNANLDETLEDRCNSTDTSHLTDLQNDACLRITEGGAL